MGIKTLFNLESGEEIVRLSRQGLGTGCEQGSEGRGWQRKSHLGSVCRSAGQAGEMCKKHRFDHAKLIRLWLSFSFTGADT